MPKGYSTSGDILQRTRDGQDLNEIWRQYSEALAEFNSTRTPFIDLLSFPVTQVIEEIVQPGQERFEEATEFGIPQSIRPAPTPFARAYPFKWWDIRQAYTFQFLAGGPGQAEGASTAQLDAVMDHVMEADNFLQFDQVMKALFNDANRSVLIDGTTYSVPALYNADGTYIPPWKGQTFDPNTHTHYTFAGSDQTAFDPDDLTATAGLVEEHGYTRAQGYNILILMNPADANAGPARYERGELFDNGASAGPPASEVLSLYDFIPSGGQNLTVQLPPGFTLVGGLPSNTFAGLDVIGSWGPYLIITDVQIPVGYMVAVATRGQATNTNVVGIREHANASLRGLVLRPGNNQAYPLIDSFFIRGLGSAVGPRGAAAIMRLDAAAYAVPSAFTW